MEKKGNTKHSTALAKEERKSTKGNLCQMKHNKGVSEMKPGTRGVLAGSEKLSSTSPTMTDSFPLFKNCSEKVLLLFYTPWQTALWSHIITKLWEGEFSFSFLKLESDVCASMAEIETLAERGPLSGDPSCQTFQTHLLNLQHTGQAYAIRQTRHLIPEIWPQILVSRGVGGVFWKRVFREQRIYRAFEADVSAREFNSSQQLSQ